ncbi:hypothetical protein [Streptomyces malaysiensis]|uniref:hypothetical protein n=1 Tax=Streptomyces malaysiensis TaxID=92644 RepID=UPI0036B90892
MHQTLTLGGPKVDVAVTAQLSVRERIAAEIEASETVSTRVIQSDGLLMVHAIAKPVGEYWDIAYAGGARGEEIAELADLEERVYKRYGLRLQDIVMERQEIDRPHPLFPFSASHTYVRLCPKVAL